jgi:hypothetical protein
LKTIWDVIDYLRSGKASAEPGSKTAADMAEIITKHLRSESSLLGHAQQDNGVYEGTGKGFEK